MDYTFFARELVATGDYDNVHLPDGTIINIVSEGLNDVATDYNRDFVPQVVTIGTYAIDEDEEYGYIVYHPVPGISLSEYVKQPVRMNWRQLEQELRDLFRRVYYDQYQLSVESISQMNIHDGRLYINDPLAIVEADEEQRGDGEEDEFIQHIMRDIERHAGKEFLLANRDRTFSRANLSRNTYLLKTWPEVLRDTTLRLIDNWEPHEISVFAPREFILANPNIRWDKGVLSRRKDFTVADQNLVLPNSVGYWNFYTLPSYEYNHDPIDTVRSKASYNIAYNKGASYYDIDEEYLYTITYVIPIEQILARPDAPWNRLYLSQNPTITWEAMKIIDRMPNVTDRWIYSYLSKSLPMEDIRRNPTEKWNRAYLSRNPGVTLDDVLMLNLPNAFNKWDWDYLSRTLAMDEIRANPHLSWDKKQLSLNPEITMYDMKVWGIPRE